MGNICALDICPSQFSFHLHKCTHFLHKLTLKCNYAGLGVKTAGADLYLYLHFQYLYLHFQYLYLHMLTYAIMSVLVGVEEDRWS